MLSEHEELLGAIEARDGEAARRIAEHYMFGAREVAAHLRRSSEPPAVAEPREVPNPSRNRER